MREYITIQISNAYINVSFEDLDAAGGDAVQAAQNALGFTGLTVADAGVYSYTEDGDDAEGDVVSLDAHPELSDEDAL